VTTPPRLTGLVVTVPEAEVAVGRLRARLDAHAALGVPAHVTVLFPFVPADDLDDGVLQRVRAVVDTVPRFAYRFDRTDWFGDDVLWLAPADPVPFRRLTGLLAAEFPDHPPFGGRFDAVVPHLTVGQGHPRPVLAAAERDVTPHLPITGRAGEVTVLVQAGPGGRWSRRATVPLG
jgi:2'-5' RNA ligase